MPTRSHRSGSFRRTGKRTLSGVRVRMKRKGPGRPRCACGRPLSSVARVRGVESKSSRKSNRPYGGSLCPVCARHKALADARGQLQS